MESLHERISEIYIRGNRSFFSLKAYTYPRVIASDNWTRSEIGIRGILISSLRVVWHRDSHGIVVNAIELWAVGQVNRTQMIAAAKDRG